MKNFKKILTGTLVSIVSATAIGGMVNTKNLTKINNNSMADVVSNVNKLDSNYTNSKSSEKIGKIIETNAILPFDNRTKDIKNRKNTSTKGSISYFNNNISENDIENSIIKPFEDSNFNLFVLSDFPFITLTSEDAPTDFSFCVKISANRIDNSSSEIDSKINLLFLKRSMLMIYVNEIYGGKVNLSNDSKIEINNYVNILKDNTTSFNSNRNLAKNQLKTQKSSVANQNSDNSANYNLNKTSETTETRASRIDTSISAIDSIIQIIENNLLPSSNYYNSKLSNTYNDLMNNIKSSETTNGEITQSSTNKEIADKISNSLNFTKEQLSDSLSESNNSNKINNDTKDIKQIANDNKIDENSVIKNLNTNTNNTNSNSFINNNSLSNTNKYPTFENRNNNQINDNQNNTNTNLSNNSSTSRNEYVSNKNNNQNTNTNEYIANKNSYIQNNSNLQNKKTITFPKRNKNSLSQTNKVDSEKNANFTQNNKKKPRNLANNENSMQNSNNSNSIDYNNQISQNERFIPKKIETNETTTNGDYLKNNNSQNNKINLINTYPNNNYNNNEISKRVEPSNVYRPTVSQERPLARRLISTHIVPAENKAVRVPYKTNSNFKVQ